MAIIHLDITRFAQIYLRSVLMRFGFVIAFREWQEIDPTNS
jgi:hypothetical protein